MDHSFTNVILIGNARNKQTFDIYIPFDMLLRTNASTHLLRWTRHIEMNQESIEMGP